jgi:integrase
MAVYRDSRDATWRYRKRLRLQDGTELRISGTPAINTKMAAETAERAHILRAQAMPSAPAAQEPQPRKEVPSFRAFAEDFMAGYVRANNKPSEQTAKASILKKHLLPTFGRVPLDRIGVQEIEKMKAALLERVSRKRVNNILNVLNKILKYAHELEVIERVPRIKTLKVPPTAFDFFTYEELDRLVDAASEEPEWQAAIIVAGDAGLRMGEILALQWEDIDLATGTLTAIQELAGHQSITVTNRYMHLAPGELRNAIALLDRSARPARPANSGQQVANN